MLIRVVIPILLVAAHEGEHDDDDHEDNLGSSSDKSALESAMPTEKPTFAKITKATPDDGQYNAQIDLPVECRTADTWDTCPGKCSKMTSNKSNPIFLFWPRSHKIENWLISDLISQKFRKI